MAPKILIYHFVSPTFKFTFKIISVLCLRPAHSIHYSFTITIAMGEPVASMCRLANYGSGGKYGLEFIRCVDRRQPKIHEVWTYGEDGVTPKVHPTARVDVSALVRECFATNYLNPTCCRIPMFGRNYINGTVEWLGIPNFPRNDGPPWTLNFLAPYANWGDRGSSTSPNWSSGSGEHSDSVFILWN